ncbi:MAG: T9SS type A sorting domain-containing protein [Candidatus Electryonea clarkiae]|nr:T9SS type A sorting domain-containing protein [Candidatus Electryonea clarkiae]MDP8286010.1 T9SS type A sorting domain-containing protein [Candidatus Electryonea clarkiae]
MSVHGTLDINGSDTDTSPILIDRVDSNSEWYGIAMNSGTVTIIETTIKHAYDGIVMAGGDLTAEDFIIDNCKYGLHITADMTADISFGTIENCSIAGIYASNVTALGDVLIEELDIAYNDIGVYLYNSSSPTFNDNYVYENDVNGMFATTNSNITIGVFTVLNQDGNRFMNNGADITGTTIGAELNILNSTPVWADIGNDFIDENEDENDNNEILIYYSGDEHEFSCSNTFFHGDEGVDHIEWFFPDDEDYFDLTDARFGDDDDDPYRGAYSISAFRIAYILKMQGEYEEAADIFLELAEEEGNPTALSQWIICQNDLGANVEDIIEELADWIDHETLGYTAYWTRIALQNQNEDFELSIAQLDTFILETETPEDSLAGVLGQLETYTQMYYTGHGDNELQKGAPVGDGQNSMGLSQMGMFSYPVPMSLKDSHEKREALLHQIQNGVDKPDALSGTLPTEFELGSPYPNPFNPTVVVPFTTPSVSDIRLTVFDILGREVIRLIDGKSEVGRHKVVWNGTDSNGIPVSSGVYLINMKAGDYSATQKAVLVK